MFTKTVSTSTLLPLKALSPGNPSDTQEDSLEVVSCRTRVWKG